MFCVELMKTSHNKRTIIKTHFEGLQGPDGQTPDGSEAGTQAKVDELRRCVHAVIPGALNIQGLHVAGNERLIFHGCLCIKRSHLTKIGKPHMATQEAPCSRIGV